MTVTERLRDHDSDEEQLLNKPSTPTSKPTPPANNTSLGVKIWILIALALQNAAHALLSRYSKGILKETYDGSEVILVGEVLKLVISGYISFKDPSETGVSRYAMPSMSFSNEIHVNKQMPRERDGASSRGCYSIRRRPLP